MQGYAQGYRLFVLFRCFSLFAVIFPATPWLAELYGVAIRFYLCFSVYLRGICRDLQETTPASRTLPFLVKGILAIHRAKINIQSLTFK